MKATTSFVNSRKVFIQDEEIRLRVLGYTDGMTASQLLEPCYRGFLTRVVDRVLREIAFEKLQASRFDLEEIQDFMG